MNNETNECRLRHLTLGNIEISKEFMNVIICKALPVLYSFEIFNIKCFNGISEKTMFLSLREEVDYFPKRSILIRLRIS